MQNSKLAHVRQLKPANVQRCQFGICERATLSLTFQYSSMKKLTFVSFWATLQAFQSKKFWSLDMAGRGEFVAKKFKPPAFETLASVDSAKCEYVKELTEITGVVSLSSQGGWPKCDDYEVHCFEFAAWRRSNESLVEKPLTILRPVRDAGKAFNDFEDASVHRVQVLLSADQTRAVFAKRIGSAVDVDLEKIGQRLKEPVVVQTERFGALTLDRRVNWFAGQATWNGQVVSINIQPDDNFDLTNQLKTAEVLFSDSKAWGQKVREFAVQEKLELANDWQEEEVSEEEFLERMTLESISIQPEGRFEFWHNDGDLFWGHSIQISGSVEEGLTDSDIPG